MDGRYGSMSVREAIFRQLTNGGKESVRFCCGGYLVQKYPVAAAVSVATKKLSQRRIRIPCAVASPRVIEAGNHSGINQDLRGTSIPGVQVDCKLFTTLSFKANLPRTSLESMSYHSLMSITSGLSTSGS